MPVGHPNILLPLSLAFLLFCCLLSSASYASKSIADDLVTDCSNPVYTAYANAETLIVYFVYSYGGHINDVALSGVPDELKRDKFESLVRKTILSNFEACLTPPSLSDKVVTAEALEKQMYAPQNLVLIIHLQYPYRIADRDTYGLLSTSAYRNGQSPANSLQLANSSSAFVLDTEKALIPQIQNALALLKPYKFSFHR